MVGCYHNPVASSTGTGGSNSVCSSGESGELPYCAAGSSRSRRTHLCLAQFREICKGSGPRGTGAGRALVEGLVALGKEQGWKRVYWHPRKQLRRSHAL